MHEALQAIWSGIYPRQQILAYLLCAGYLFRLYSGSKVKGQYGNTYLNANNGNDVLPLDFFFFLFFAYLIYEKSFWFNTVSSNNMQQNA